MKRGESLGQIAVEFLGDAEDLFDSRDSLDSLEKAFDAQRFKFHARRMFADIAGGGAVDDKLTDRLIGHQDLVDGDPTRIAGFSTLGAALAAGKLDLPLVDKMGQTQFV